MGWTSISSAPKSYPTTASQTFGTSRRCTAVTWQRWSRPTTPRGPWWSTCVYRKLRPEVRERERVCVTQRLYNRKRLLSIVCSKVKRSRGRKGEHPRGWRSYARCDCLCVCQPTHSMLKRCMQAASSVNVGVCVCVCGEWQFSLQDSCRRQHFIDDLSETNTWNQ